MKNYKREAESLKFLGWSSYLLGDYKKAIEDWDKAKATLKKGSLLLFWFLEDQEAYDKARKALNQR